MSRKWLMWAGCGAMVLAGGYFLWSKGYQNILGYGMLLLCPLMHVLMMGSHGHGDHQHQNSNATGAGEKGQDGGGRPACH